MTTYFITGDRSMDPVTALEFLFMSLKSLPEDDQPSTGDVIYTGNLMAGIERAVRYLFFGVNVVSYSANDEGVPNFDESFKLMSESGDGVDRVLFIHSDPLGSHIGAAVMQNFDPAKVTILP